jgi:hypothetical protein
MGEESAAAPSPDPSEALEALPRQFAEIGEHLGSYLGAKWAQQKGSFRNGAIVFALGALLILLLTGAFLVAIAFVLYGSALLLGQVLGGRTWAGYLISGGSLLIFGLGYLRWKIKSLRRASLEKKVLEYEHKLERQKEKYGLNALERAASPD